MLSILGIIETWTYNVDNIEAWLQNILKVSPALEEIILSAVNESSTSILSWISGALLPQMEKIMESVTTGLNDMYIFISDFIIGIVFSVYILANKNKFMAQLKKVTYSLLGIKKGNSLLQSARYSYKVFNGFIKGKLLTSLIIGSACYISMSILRLPHTLLISII
jgi:predicted PurR-regulated permease PerM